MLKTRTSGHDGAELLHSSWEVEVGAPLISRSAWSIEKVSGQSRLYRETMS